MHASFLVALALGGTAVSAACDPYCNFAASYDCSQNGGHHFTKDQMISILVNADRSGAPYEVWADNLATTYCSGVEYGDMPLWTVGLPDGAGTVFYALASNGTFYFCGSQSGTASSGWPDSCHENSTN
ncbi:hypothetical protein ACJQWK_09114 [Exserohilum turcicum]|uniref:Uncharacterized protein n=1 Tax=Exserohilum turcicum (strain 28A) TaxID=671987 RepID=R0K443_EXST2|nr:uncharacterized protein SETTUDRAFT_27800 [Exserohilum turcica Et28A]EOA87863.1 hypothetical protein SETTUDRAFT_27800 [Exserohilum turcica Et28A]